MKSSAAAAPPLRNTPKKKKQRHPLWTTLAAVDNDQALAILDHLLHQGLLAPDVVRSAYAAVCAQEGAKASPAEEATEDAEEDAKEATAKASPAAVALEVPPSVVTGAPLSSSIRTRHIALEVFYDGEHYTGLAENVGQAKDNSVERALFQALVQCKLIESRETARYSRCGRTDKGVSAAGQVVALHVKSAFGPTVAWDAAGQDLLQEDDLPNCSLVAKRVWVTPRKATLGASGIRQEKNLNEMAYDQILNNLLPPTIRVLGWTPVSADFSARFSATGRIYRYLFRQRQLNVEKMRDGLAAMVGTHDFRNLCKLNVEEVSNFCRKIHRAEIVPLGESDQEMYRLEICGQAFLWHQIRCIVSVLFMIGRGLEEPSIVPELLNVHKLPGKPSYPLADEKPLVLHHCAYAGLQFGYSMRNLWAVMCHQERRWEDLRLAAARIRNSVDKMGEGSMRVADLLVYAEERLAVRRKKAGKHRQVISDATGAPPLTSPTISFKEALAWLATLDFYPEPDGSKDFVHIPLLKRDKGTTYEEKVASLQNKRRGRFEENTIKKRKTKDEDKAFYEHMTKQGGSAFD